MRKTQIRSRMPAVTVALLLATSLVLGSCATTKRVRRERRLDLLELVAGLEQTREFTVEEKLMYALSRLFGVDNVVVLVSSRAHYGTFEESEEVEAHDDEPARVLSRTTGPGQIQRVTIAVMINSDVLTPEEREDTQGLREELYRIVADGAGLTMDGDDEFGDSVSILFMPFAD